MCLGGGCANGRKGRIPARYNSRGDRFALLRVAQAYVKLSWLVTFSTGTKSVCAGESQRLKCSSDEKCIWYSFSFWKHKRSFQTQYLHIHLISESKRLSHLSQHNTYPPKSSQSSLWHSHPHELVYNSRYYRDVHPKSRSHIFHASEEEQRLWGRREGPARDPNPAVEEVCSWRWIGDTS